MNTTWRNLIRREMKEHGESWDDVVRCSLSSTELDVEFDAGFGLAYGKPFTLWTDDRVYFPTEYDGAEGAGSAPRFPCDEVMEHI